MMSAFAFLWHHCVSENLRGGCEWDHPRNIICKYSACFDLWPIAGELCLQQEMMSDTKGNNTSCFASEGALLSFSISLTLSQVLNRLWKTITVKQCDQMPDAYQKTAWVLYKHILFSVKKTFLGHLKLVLFHLFYWRRKIWVDLHCWWFAARHNAQKILFVVLTVCLICLSDLRSDLFFPPVDFVVPFDRLRPLFQDCVLFL